jgi:hypothetical protein
VDMGWICVCVEFEFSFLDFSWGFSILDMSLGSLFWICFEFSVLDIHTTGVPYFGHAFWFLYSGHKFRFSILDRSLGFHIRDMLMGFLFWT